MGIEDERTALSQLPLAKEVIFDELPMLIQAFELGTLQAKKIHNGKATCVEVLVGGKHGCKGSFYEDHPSTTMFDYSQMLIAAGVYLEDLRDNGECLEVVDPVRSNGNLHMKQINIQNVDLYCIRAQLLGLLHGYDGSIDDYRVLGIIGDALRHDVFNPKARKQNERREYAAMVARLQNGNI